MPQGAVDFCMRVADYIAETLAAHGIRHVFVVTGGGAMHLNDAFARCSGMKVVCCHHEQACSIAAESYFRVSNRLAAVNVTTGPGGTNAVTGVYGAYVDSLGMIVVSGQSKWETLVRSTHLPLRQLGDQEVDIVRMVDGITKYAVLVDRADTIRYHLERALYLATHGRPGPVWLDVPVNVQAMQIDPDQLPGYDPAEDAIKWETHDLDAACQEILRRLAAAERPVVYAGSGVRLSGHHQQFVQLLDRLGIPVVTAWNSNDLVPDDHPCYAGRPGSVGNRAGNFAVQNSDVLLILGCRLNIRLVSYNWENFARHAYKIWVDIDAAELKKPTVRPDLPVHADLAVVLPRLLAMAEASAFPAERFAGWRAWCKERLARYPVVLPSYWAAGNKVNPYCFMDRLFAHVNPDETIVTADGTACVAAFQAARVGSGMRLYHNSGSAPMGYDLPAAIGAAFAQGLEKRVVCIAGDGSIMMNLQELQTIAGLRLPIKTFVLSNEGYHSIRQTQQAFFKDNVIGCGTDSGLSFPEWKRIADAFGMPFVRIEQHQDLDDAIRWALQTDGPTLCEVVLDLSQPFAPKLSSRKLEDGRMVTSPLEDMAPFLPREELQQNMIVPLLQPPSE
jgi:acetolactate synthase-1/2/3 large subunit